MKKIRNFIIGGIQHKVFSLVLFVMLLMLAAYSAVMFVQTSRLSQLASQTSERQEQAISEVSGSTMSTMVEKELRANSEMEAYIADGAFRDLKNDITMLGNYLESLMDSPDTWEPAELLPPDLSLRGKPSAQLLCEEGADPSDPRLQEDLELLGGMRDIMMAVFRNAPVNSVFMGVPGGMLLIVDENPGAKYTEGVVMDFPVRDRPWYREAERIGELFFTEVERDTFTGKLGVIVVLPVFHEGRMRAVIGFDLFLDSMDEIVQFSNTYGSFVSIVNENGHVVFSPRMEGSFRAALSEDAPDLRESPDPDLAGFVKDALKRKTDVRLVEVDGEEWYLCGAPMKTIGWTVISATSKEIVDRPKVMMLDRSKDIQEEERDSFRAAVGQSRKTISILILGVFLLGLLGAQVLSGRIVRPLNRMTENVRRLGGKDLQFRMEKDYRTGDEIEILAESFEKLSARTLQYVDEVQRVTAEKERIGAELGMATAIQASQLPHLFPAFPDRTEFDIYASMIPAREVGGDFYDFFLVDHDHIALVMADVSGKGVPAALFMMIAKILIRNRVQSGESPAKALARVNDQLLEGNEAELFVTVWLAVLEIPTGKGVAANAGHEHPVLRRADGAYELVTYRHSPAVATIEGMRFREHEFELRPGDSLFVYTDGVAEATNAENELFGTDRMLSALNREPDAAPEQVLRNVKEGIDGFVAEAEQFDDITMLCLKYNGPGAD